MNFYTTGGTVQAGDGIYLPRPADTELLQLCQAGEFVYILTARQMGKSSLMGATADSLRQQNVLPLVLDLQSIGTEATAEQWYLGLLIELEKDLEENHGLSLSVDLFDWWQTHNNLGMTQRFTLFFRDVLLQDFSQPIVVFVDEIDTTLSLSFTDDFFIAIRYFYTARAQTPAFNRLSFVLLGAAMPGDLIKDSQRTPFNIGSRLDLEDFTLQEALPLAKGLELPASQAQKILEWVLHWTGGHPYLTQRLCQVLVETSERKEHSFDWTKAGVEQVVRRTFLEGGDRSDRNLQFVRDRLTSKTNTVNSEDLLRTYRDIWKGKRVEDDERSLIKSHLKLSGIVKQASDHSLTLRNPLYRRIFDKQWIKANLPESWWERNKDVLRWAVPVTAVSVVSAIAMGTLSLVALHQRSLAQSQNIRASANAAKFYLLSNQPLDGMTTAIDAWQTVERFKRQDTAESVLSHSALIHAAYYNFEFNRNISQAVVDPSVLRTGFRERNSRDLPIGVRALSPDGTTVVVGYNSVELRSLSSSDTTPISFSAVDGTVVDAAFSPSGEEVAIASANGTVKIWNTQGQEIATFDYGNRIDRVTFSPDGKTIAIVGRGNSIQLWNFSVNNVSTLASLDTVLQAVTFSPNGRILATASRNGNVLLWDASTGQALATLTHGNNPVTSITISPDGTAIAAADNQGRIKLWDISSGREIADFSHRSSGNTTVAFSPNATLIASTGQDGSIQLWNRQGTLLQTLEGHSEGTSLIRFSNDNTLISADDTWKVWSRIDDAPQPLIQSVEAHEFSNGAIAFSSDGTMLASASQDGIVKVLSQTGESLHEFDNLDVEISAIAFGPNNNTLALGDVSGQVKLWDFKDSNQVKAIGEHVSPVIDLAFHPNENILLAADANGVIKRRNLETQTTQQLQPQNDINYITSVAFSRDGNTIAIASDDNTVRMLDAEGLQIATLSFQGQDSPTLNEQEASNIFSDLAFSPAGDILAWANVDSRVTLWTRDGQLLTVLNGHRDNVTGVAFSADGRIIATSSNDGSLRLWNREGELLNILDSDQDGQRSVLFGLAFSPVSNTLATSNDLGFIEFWELNPQALISWNCNWLQDYLQSAPAEQLAVTQNSCQADLP